MKILFRIILALLVLGLLCGLAAAFSTFTAVPWLSAFVQQMTAQYTWLPLAFSIVLLFFMALCVLALAFILSVPGRSHLYILGRDAGRIEITRQSIESAAAATLEGMPEVKRSYVQAKGSMRPSRLRLDVQAEPRSAEVNLADMSRAIQQRLAAGLADSLAMDPKHIRVRIEPIHHLGAGQQTAKVPRVV